MKARDTRLKGEADAKQKQAEEDGHKVGSDLKLNTRWNSCVDLNDGPVSGGKLSSYTIGLNWYLCPNAKLQFQYLKAHRHETAAPLVPGDVQGFGIRTVLEF